MQKIKSLLADGHYDDMLPLENMLSKEYRNMHFCGKANTLDITRKLIKINDPDLVFINVKLFAETSIQTDEYLSNNTCELVLLVDNYKNIVDGLTCSACGYLIKPVQERNMRITVNNAIQNIYARWELERLRLIANKYYQKSLDEDLVGIPTIDGLEFIPIKDIIRCESLQKCTQVVTIDRTDIISSYNLGEFRKILDPYGFYSPHKSHLINLRYIKKYFKEGNILMTNNFYVPVARRKRTEFLNRVTHI
jgi:two-component system LytT family response regulator